MKIIRILFGLIVIAIVMFVLYKAVDSKSFQFLNYGRTTQKNMNGLVGSGKALVNQTIQSGQQILQQGVASGEAYIQQKKNEAAQYAQQQLELQKERAKQQVQQAVESGVHQQVNRILTGR